MKLFLSLVLALLIATAAFGEDYKFTVNVDNGGETITIVPRAEHLRVSCATAGLSFTAWSYVTNVNGARVGVQRHPYLGTGSVAQYPFAAGATDSVYTIYDTSIAAWNTFNNVPVDSMRIHNATGSAVNVTIEYRR